MERPSIPKILVEYTIEQVESLLSNCSLPDGDPYQEVLDIFIRDTCTLWAALLDGSLLNQNQDELIEKLVFTIVTKDEYIGHRTKGVDR